MVPIAIPKGALKDVTRWTVRDPRVADLAGFSVRDMAFDPDTKRVLILAGPLFQDKAKAAIDQYSVYSWHVSRSTKPHKEHQRELNPKHYAHLMHVPRLLNGELKHDDVRRKAWEGPDVKPDNTRDQKAMKKARAAKKEKPTSMCSPEGIAVWIDPSKPSSKQLLVCWDQNDLGLYTTFPFPHKK